MRKPTPLKRAFFESQRTQKDVAAEIGMDEGQLSRIVNGLHCDERKQHLIADALGMTVEECFNARPESKAAA